MMKNIRVLLACLFLGGWAMQLVAQSTSGSDAKAPCVADGLTKEIRRSYPNGVPGRTLPQPIRTERVAEGFIYYIPVVVHIMHAYGNEQNVSPIQVQTQIDVLNETFGRYGSGLNADSLSETSTVRFCLAQIDPEGNPTPGYEYVLSNYAAELNPYTEDTFMKRLTIWDPKRYLNIWTVRSIDNGRFEGYAYLPSDLAGTVWDGIVVDHHSFGRFPAGTAETLGKTVTHEAGHYLGLYHPWGLEELICGEEDTDYCDDTPPVPEIYYSHVPNCPKPFACDSTLRQVANYMDYADDGCQNMFTKCQVGRIRNNLLTYRAELVTAENLRITGCAEVLDTVAPTNEIYVYPVPAYTYLMVNMDFEDVGSIRIELVDLMGRRVYKNLNTTTGAGKLAIDVSGVAAGIYMLNIATNTVEFKKRVVIGY